MPTRTILVNGNGTGTLAFQLDGPDITDVEAVLAEIDTSGAGDTIATLTATSPAGSDVAAVPQGAPVSGGGQGRATWALRLAEDGGSAPPPPPPPLTVSDGSTTVTHTTEIDVSAPLAVVNEGPGMAGITLASAYAFGHLAPTPGVTTAHTFTIVTDGSNNIAATGTTWTLQQSGLYLVGHQMELELFPAGISSGQYIAVGPHSNLPGHDALAAWGNPPDIPVGTTEHLSIGATRLMSLSGGEQYSYVAQASGSGVASFQVVTAWLYVVRLG